MLPCFETDSLWNGSSETLHYNQACLMVIPEVTGFIVRVTLLVSVIFKIVLSQNHSPNYSHSIISRNQTALWITSQQKPNLNIMSSTTQHSSTALSLSIEQKPHSISQHHGGLLLYIIKQNYIATS